MPDSASTAEARPGEGGGDAVPPSTPTELLRGLAHLAESPGPAHGALAEALGLPEPSDGTFHTDLFVFQLYPHASVYLGPDGALGGEAEVRVRGFWQAVGREAPPEPDHLVSLLGRYAALADEEAEWVRSAPDAAAPPAAVLVRNGRRALLDEYLVPWVFAYLARVRELGGAFFAAWATLLADVLSDEVRATDAGGTVPSALATVATLPDPRTEGGAPFLSALVVPLRSGLILTRADIAKMASALGLGLRAGERRYALEHLLGQDARGVLAWLAAEAGRQADLFARAAPGPGDGLRVLAARARDSAGLLDELVAATSQLEGP